MTSLRMRVVEAGMEAESLHGFTEETQRLIAEDLLETFLDCLAAFDQVLVPPKEDEPVATTN